MQRLFSFFPDSWPGMGLLLLRFTAAASLIAGALALAAKTPSSLSYLVELTAIAIALLLIIGFATPLAATVHVMIEAWLLVSAAQNAAVAALSAVVGTSLIMLGPGAWSVDSRLFGRRRIHLPGD